MNFYDAQGKLRSAEFISEESVLIPVMQLAPG